MRANTLYQPWASLWLTDRKVHETRPRALNYSGWLAVHAGKTFITDPDELGPELVDILNAEFGTGWAKALPTGGIIGAVNMVSCKRMADTAPASHDDEICGNWKPRRFALRRTEVIKLKEPIAFRGQQYLFPIPDWAASQILNPAMAA